VEVALPLHVGGVKVTEAVALPAEAEGADGVSGIEPEDDVVPLIGILSAQITNKNPTVCCPFNQSC